MVNIQQVDAASQVRAAQVLGRSFVTEPMMAWPLGGEECDLEERCVQAYTLYVPPLAEAGLVWETDDGHGAMVLLAPDSGSVWDEALDHVEDGSEHTVTDDDGGRHERLWEWVAMKASSDSCWHLDSVGVEPGWQGRGIGSALIQFALGQARATNHPMLLETGTPRNVPLYQRLGFDIVEEDDAPEGGPHVWFMRCEP